MRLVPGAFLALMGMIAFAPSTAQAGCNNHVRSAGQPRLLGLDSLSDLLAETLDGVHDPFRPQGVPPCSGPTCSEGSQVPFSPLTVSSSRHHELWCNTAVSPPGNRLEHTAALVKSASLYRLDRLTDIDRPPRPRAA
jgi:hypothetical protein